MILMIQPHLGAVDAELQFIPMSLQTFAHDCFIVQYQTNRIANSQLVNE